MPDSIDKRSTLNNRNNASAGNWGIMWDDDPAGFSTAASTGSTFPLIQDTGTSSLCAQAYCEFDVSGIPSDALIISSQFTLYFNSTTAVGVAIATKVYENDFGTPSSWEDAWEFGVDASGMTQAGVCNVNSFTASNEDPIIATAWNPTKSLLLGQSTYRVLLAPSAWDVESPGISIDEITTFYSGGASASFQPRLEVTWLPIEEQGASTFFGANF